ncbi:MAG TPA: hypothetical protein VK761_05310 [Solirubrobacteraceae bacterium]|jgi:hypothetical protein|nr:hypothetical protein [Solirubrobacteraceae bacterium]
MNRALVAVATALAALIGLLTRRLLRARSRAAPVVIEQPQSLTELDDATGAVRSLQSAEISLPEQALEQIWSPEYLERLARTYWRFLTRVTLGLIHVDYSESERSIVLLARPLKLLTFDAPEYEMSELHGLVRWRIARGVLVASRGRDGGGYLQIEVRRDEGDGDPRAADSPYAGPHVRLRVSVEVANFYPSIASRLGRRIYDATQSRIHVIVTNRFLRSLARMDFAESRVGRYRV